MGVIFSLSGCKAVGKTTLINGLRKKMPDLIIREGFRQIDTGYNMKNEQDYYANEKWYIEREIKEYKEYRSQSFPVMLLRGPEDLEFYAFHYSKLNNFDWDIELNLKEDLQALRRCRSDYILYLDADMETILQRKVNDNKRRLNMDDWLLNWQPYIEKKIKDNPRTTILNTGNMNAAQVLNWTIDWMEDKILK